MPALADPGEFLASESSFHRVLHEHRQRADGPNQLWSWGITGLTTSVRGVWLYLYLVVDVGSRKIVAWDVTEREEARWPPI